MDARSGGNLDVWHWVVDNVRALLVVLGSLLGFAAQSAPYVEALKGEQPLGDIYRTDTLEARVRVIEPADERDPSPVDIEVRNTSKAPYDLAVEVSDELAGSYENVAMVPEPAHPEDDPWSVRIERLGPGEARLVALELQGPRPGPHAGHVRIVAPAGDEIAIPVRTLNP